MLSIHHVSIMVWIFYIDWQQYMKGDWTMNIGANRNAHGKRTVSTKQPQMTDLTVGLPDIGEVLRYFFFFFFFFWGGGGGVLLGAVYLSQGRRGYLAVSNVALVTQCVQTQLLLHAIIGATKSNDPISDQTIIHFSLIVGASDYNGCVCCHGNELILKGLRVIVHFISICTKSWPFHEVCLKAHVCARPHYLPFSLLSRSTQHSKICLWCPTSYGVMRQAQ